MKIITVLAAAAIAAGLDAQVTVDLRTGVIHDLGPAIAVTSGTGAYSNAYMKVTVAKNTAACTLTPYTALVEINLKPVPAGGASPAEMKRAIIDVEYGSPDPNPNSIPTGWVTHIGDDPANDGYGGGSSLEGVAEAHVTNQTLLVYSTGLQPGIVQNIVAQDLQLEKGTLRFEVANQLLGWGQPRNILDSKQAKKLFAFPDAKGDYRLFAAFNRVIGGRADRVGCGAARATIQLEAQ